MLHAASDRNDFPSRKRLNCEAIVNTYEINKVL